MITAAKIVQSEEAAALRRRRGAVPITKFTLVLGECNVTIIESVRYIEMRINLVAGERNQTLLAGDKHYVRGLKADAPKRMPTRPKHV
jgi:hypothetical protein